MRRLLFLLFLPCFSCVSVAQTVDVSILIDRSGSGDCTVAGVDPVNGVDARLTASVDSATAQVDVLTLETCQGGSFGAPQTLDGGFPVGLNNGEGGADVVELSVDSAALGSGSAQFTFTALADDGSSVDQARGGFAGITVPVPLAPWALLVLALALGVIALWAISRHRGPTVLLLGLVAVTAWAAHFMLDGEISDWTGVTPISDPAGDATGGGNRTDILAVFSAEEDGRLWFRVDLADIENASPTAANDAFSTDGDTVLSGENVLADNGSGADSDPDGDVLTVSGFDAISAEGAAVTIAANGDLEYDPTGVTALQALAVGESQDDTFTYTIEDPDGSSDSATVTVTVDGVNDAPTASDDAFATDKNTPITTTSVLVNDTDPDTSDTLSVDAIDTTATAGLVTDNGDGTFDYDPYGQFDGLGDGDSDTDSFVYTVTDGNGGTDTATVTITINGANTAPVATDDAFVTDEDSALTTGDVLANDTDAEGDALSVDSFDTTGMVGSVTDNGDGTFEYDPNGQFESLADGDSDTDIFVYTVTDGNGATDTATVTITINGVNDAPEADDLATTTDEEMPVTITLTGSDVEGDPLTFAIATGPADGSLGAITQLTPTSAEVTYTPDPDFNDPDSFTFTVNDGTVDSPAATVSISVDAVNDAPSFTASNPPVVNEDAGAQTVNGWAVFDPGPNEGGQSVLGYTVSNITNSALFSAGPGVDTSGNLSYTPATDAFGTSDFDVTVQDDGGTANGGTDTSAVQTFTITVNAVDDPPVAVDDSATITEDDPATTIDVLVNDTDVDGGPISITGVTQPANGTVVNNTTDLTYQPDPNYCNDGVTTDDFTYTLNGGSTATVAVTVTCVNDPPVADDEMISAACNIEGVVETDPGQSAAATGAVFRTVADNVLDGDSDPVEGTAVAIVQADGLTSDTTAPFQITTNEGGSLTLHADGSFTYTPEAGDRSVADTFTYTIEDADGGQDSAAVTLNLGATCAWFVDNSTGADDTGTGTSSDPFTSLVDELGPDALPDDAEDASVAGDVIYVFEGNSTNGDPYDGNFVAQAGERLLGQGVDLVMDFGSGPETLFTGDLANRPLVVGVSAGVAVNVIDVTGVEVAGLELAGGDHAVSVSGITGAFGLDLHFNEMSGSSNESIVVNQSGAFDSTLAITANAVTAATGDSLNVEVSDGTLALAIDGNALTSMANGIDLDGTGALLYVTSFCGNTLSGDVGGIGVAARGVIFDANPSDADFTGDEVGCTGIPTSIGSALNPVAFAMLLEDVAGDLAFGTLDLYSDGVGQVGLEVTGTGPLDAAAGTGFEITSTSGTVDSANGPALTLYDSTLGLILVAVTSNDSPSHGVLLNAVNGTFSVTGGTTVTSSAGLGIDATASPGVAVDFDATSLSGSGGGIRLASSSGADFTFASLDVTTTGTALDVNTAGTVNIGGVANTLETTAGAAIRAQLTSMGAGGWTFDSLTSTNSPSVGILLNAMTGGNFLVTGATDINEPMATGIEVSTGGARTYDFGSTDISGAGSVVPISGGRGVNAIFGNSMSSLVFDSLNITTDNGAGLVTNGVGLLAIAGASNSIVANNGNALWLESTTVDELPGGPVTGITFATLSSANSPLDGISLRSVTGSVTGNAGSITGALDVAVHIGSGANNSGGSGNVTYAGSITNTVDHSVLVQERTGGAVTLSGNINDTGTGILVQNNNNGVANTITFSGSSKALNTGTNTAVLLDNNDDATVSFTSGGLDIDTTSGTGFSATGGGTVNITGGGNTVNTTTGAAVNIANVTIGANDVTFERVSVDGAANGILLNTTGTSGGMTITGDTGSSVNGSGGSLTNITGDAIQLTDTQNVSLDQLDMSNVSDHGIAGIRVNGLSVRNATFTSMGNADGEDVFSFDRDTFGDNGLVGIALFENLTITTFAERAIDIVNEGAGSLDLDILNVSASDNNDTFGEDAIRVQTEGSVNADVLVSGGTYDNLELDVLAYFAQGTGTNSVEVTGVTSTNGGGPDNNPNGGGVAVIGSAGSTTNFGINANSLTGVQGAVVQIIGLPGSGQTVTLNGSIGGPNLADGNSFSTDLADGLDLDFDGDGAPGSAIAGTILVQNNTIDFDDDGIGVDHRDAGGTMNVTIQDNVMTAIQGDDATLDADDGIFIFIDDDVGSNVNALNLEIIDNTVNNLTAGKHVIVVEDVQDGNDVCLSAIGNSNGGGNGDIELDTDAAADLVVDATSAADLSSLNNGIPVNEVVAPTYDSAVDCIP